MPGPISANRKVSGKKGAKMSRHYQVETHMSLTGFNADNRVQVRPSEMGAAMVALYNALTGNSGGPKLTTRLPLLSRKLLPICRLPAVNRW
jgi:molybdopterin-containing oxidoreductase family iron-sulfur binding subunit